MITKHIRDITLEVGIGTYISQAIDYALDFCRVIECDKEEDTTTVSLLFNGKNMRCGLWRLENGNIIRDEYGDIVKDLQRQIDLLKNAMYNSCDEYMDPDRILEAGSGS